MNYKRFYIPNSIIFVTIVTNNRNPLLIDYISLIKDSFKKVSQYYDFELIAFIVLKDHLHCLIKPKNIKEYPKIIKSFKYSFTKIFKVGLVNPTYDNNTNMDYKKLWQNRYWAHVIIDENDLYRHLDYIHYNPMKYYQITPKDWEYSSFQNFVKKGFYELDWCNFEDKNNIKDLDFE